ncbi:MAG TPA: histidinol dehydrogenase [Melioribacteraceae bacterium]|nr:histidinol dehydrogenase [Melioribacteraceae bacterium]
MKIFEYKNLSESELKKILSRKVISLETMLPLVKYIFDKIKIDGDSALNEISYEYDNSSRTDLKITEEELKNSANRIEKKLKAAIDMAYNNIYKFHELQKQTEYRIEVQKGIECSRKTIAIENVGLYIPGGTAVLFSTLLMLAIPAKIAGCKRIVVTSPIKKEISSALAYTALKCGINEFYTVGGIQAIAMLSLGTQSIKIVDKIFGPGNQYVTAAKVLLPLLGVNTMIDMPAGPSELLIIADNTANYEYVAADLLSQAEHGIDSQVILLSDNLEFAKLVSNEVKKQTELLPRKDLVNKCLENSASIITENLDHAINISNSYAPEHLIINTKINNILKEQVINAGSVFIGQYSCESAGDYASGTNHSLPTNGYAKAIGGVSVEMFKKNVTFQTLSKEGLKLIGESIIKMAEEETLIAHANAVKVRLK